MLAPEVPAIQKNSPPLRFATKAMVKKKTRTEVSFEFQESVVMRTWLASDCPECTSKVQMIPANEAAIIAQVTARDIYELVNSGRLHFTEDRYGLLYICSDSLRNLRT